MASVDVGSNTVRLLIGEVSGGEVKPLRYERTITGLARGLEAGGRLGKGAMEDTLQALREFLRLIKAGGVAHVRAVGTSALREAENSPEFLARVKREAGLVIEVISGREEAGLTACGVISSVPAAPCGSIVFDMGGGSTEMIFIKGREVVERATVPVGVVKLLERRIKSDPPLEGELRSLESEAESVAKTLLKGLGRHATGGTAFIGASGTATTMASVDLGLETYDRGRVHMHEIPLWRLHALMERLTSMPLSLRAEIRGLEPERADLIITGIIFTIKLMEVFGFRNLVVSDSGLLEGILIGLSKEALK